MNKKLQEELRHCNIVKSPESWNSSIFTQFDDGDIVDFIDVQSLENHHDCQQDEPEWSLAWGGRYQQSSKTDFVALGFNKATNGISVDIANHTEHVLASSELALLFKWYISWNTKTNVTVIHHSEESEISMHLSNLKWCEVRDWIMKNKFLLHVNEYREQVVPIWLDSQQ